MSHTISVISDKCCCPVGDCTCCICSSLTVLIDTDGDYTDVEGTFSLIRLDDNWAGGNNDVGIVFNTNTSTPSINITVGGLTKSVSAGTWNCHDSLSFSIGFLETGEHPQFVMDITVTCEDTGTTPCQCIGSTCKQCVNENSFYVDVTISGCSCEAWNMTFTRILFDSFDGVDCHANGYTIEQTCDAILPGINLSWNGFILTVTIADATGILGQWSSIVTCDDLINGVTLVSSGGTLGGTATVGIV